MDVNSSGLCQWWAVVLGINGVESLVLLLESCMPSSVF